jgi:predicted anti-sigma-YlaC factor YlaD
MGHEPERMAAAYLAGELGRHQRERFEAHILACEDCWREVGLGRRGRALAESMRQVAPQRLRERVRATVAATPPTRRARRRGVVVATMAVVAVVVAGGLLQAQRPAQPPAIAAAVAGYRTGVAAWPAAATPPAARRLGDLAWQASGRGELAGLPVLAHSYQDAAGHRVVLLRAERVFPEADGARPMPDGATWIAEVDGVVLFCADRPAPSLVVGQDRAEVLLAARRLGLG